MLDSTLDFIKVGFLQTHPSFGKKTANVEEAIRLSRQVETDLLILPELFNTGYNFLDRKEVSMLSEEIPGGPTTTRLLDESKRRRMTFVAGLVERSEDCLYNSAVVASRGELMGVYRKVHLFSREKILFNPGRDGFKVYDLNSFKLGVIICFDWIFPEAARVLALNGAEVIAHPSNLVLQGFAQKAMLARAVENRVYTVTANRVGVEKRGGRRLRYTGKSQIVSPEMKILASATAREVVAKSYNIDLRMARDKYITPHNDLFQDRRTKLYSGILSQL